MLLNVLPITVFAEEIADANDENTEIEGGTENDDIEDDFGDAEEIIDYSKAVDVASSDDLEHALSVGEGVIRITADFVLDRTFYVVADTVIFADEAHTLTRSPEFGGDIFLVGECSDGAPTTRSVTLTFGKPEGESGNITINGNSENMTAEVAGSVMFICNGSRARLYSALTVTNNNKVGNERTGGDYGLSYPPRIGGAVAIISKGSSMEIYGGSYTNNRVNDITDSSTDEGNLSSQGGVIYNYGTLDVYGGTFENNHAGRGGVFYNYRTMNLYNAVIRNNSASSIGGAIYVPNSTAAFTYIGEENDIVTPYVLFEGNTSESNAGAIYSPTPITVFNTVFKNNSAGSTGGALYGSSAEIYVDNSEFIGNTSGSHGAAIYVTTSNEQDDVKELEVRNSSFEGNIATGRGGAIYASGEARVYVSKSSFVGNGAAYGGAMYSTGATLEVNVAEFYDNTSGSTGGAISMYTNSTGIFNGVTAGSNIAVSSGGFLYAGATHLDIYNSSILNNESGTHGGGVTVYTGSTANIYNTLFEGNSAVKNAGGVAVYPEDKLSTVLHSCTFKNNTAGELGGGVWVSAQGQLDIYNITGTGNHGNKGGFLYITTSGTLVKLIGATVSGNTDVAGGPIIWGNTKNAKLQIDKLKYVDEDYEGDWDETYWSAAIYNLLTVTEIVGTIPSYVDYGTGEVITPAAPAATTDVETAAQLERALQVGYGSIRITADFEIDRTFYITANTTIYSTSKHTLTRAPGFGGDIFVVGESEGGKGIKDEVTLTLGKPDSADEDLLIINGNSENMTADVVGTVVFVCKGARASLHPNLTITNNKKVGNDRLITGDHTVSYPSNTGGAAMIIVGNGAAEIWGGTYSDNGSDNLIDPATGEDTLVSYGGAIYNYGKLYVYGGTFESNYAGRGGAFYNYRTMYIYNALIKGNSATTYGGAIYVPNSTSAFTYIGEDNDLVESSVTFADNTAVNGGGAIYARNLMTVDNTEFTGNMATDGSGGAIYAGSVRMTVNNSVFDKNSASSYGGAIYLSGSNEREETLELVVRDTSFTNNSGASRAGAVYMSGEARAYFYDTDFKGNTSKVGGAFYVTNANLEINVSEISGNTATSYGGALYVYSGAYALVNAAVAKNNHSDSIGGFVYANGATFDMYNSEVTGNTSVGHGAGVAIYTGATGNIYNTLFEDNASDKNGGAVAIYPEDTLKTVLHSCTFKSNTAGAFGGAVWISGKGQVDMYNTVASDNVGGSGGFLYVTTAGTILTIVGLTVSGNEDTNGGPIIWGNTANAKLFIDKGEYYDLDHTGTMDSAYWAKAIYNKLTVTDKDGTVPKYLDYGNESYDNMPDAVDVSTADELEAAILAGKGHIRIVADFELDRTFYITGDTTIFTTINHTLTRSPDFGGDFFVVGEYADGTSTLLVGNNAALTLGNPASKTEGLLVIDGNSGSMNVDVVGSVVFICNSATANLYSNVTVTNCTKVGNERTLEEKYMLGIENRIGGTVAVVASGTLNIYGGNYSYNTVNDEGASELGEEGRNSTVGAVIFNYSNLNIYGGRFEGNKGARGGVIYNYRTTRILGGSFVGNTATVSGGVYYSPNSSQCHLYVGAYDGTGSEVLFEGNRAESSGGVIYASTLSANIIYGKTSFINNTAASSGGAICCYGQLAVRDSVFTGNVASNRGGAIYTSNSSIDDTTRITEITDCSFEANAATLGGALSFYASSADYSEGAIARITSCDFVMNSASTEIAGASSANGGAIYADRKCDVKVVFSTFEGNTASTEAGAVYVAGESTCDILSSDFTANASSKHGGAITVRSSYLTIDDAQIVDNTAVANGGAIYVSYQSNRPINSKVTITNSSFRGNKSEAIGGAIYATKRSVEEEWCVLTVKDTEFTENTAAVSGGAICTTASVESYFSNVTFTSNSINEGGEYGGALYVNGGKSVINGATFKGNSAVGSGGAVYLASAQMILNNVTAESNSSGASGGFLYAGESTFDMFDSVIKSNTAANHGAVTVYTGSSANIYNTLFEGNSAGKNAGGLAVYPGEKLKTVVHSCTFKNNTAGDFGGGIWVSAQGQLDIYSVTATDNHAGYGGAFYITTSGTVVNIVGLTVSGNTDENGGSIIWGNTANAKLFIDKAKYVDSDHSGELDDAYWAKAIYNKLTVGEIVGEVPSYKGYTESTPKPEVTPTKKPVSVDEIFNLAENSKDGYINSTYDKFPVLDNSSNFMSDGTTYFENINGGTVSVDSFIYQAYAPDGNMNVGQGLMIYQAMLYKKAHPTEDVSIAISSYRFSIEAALNIDRDSRYFGYMRQLAGQEYDAYGFVRISYLLVSAAKMGIRVNVIGQIDAYPASASAPNFHEYFTEHLSTPCDTKYAEGVVGDYLDFNEALWPLNNKGGTDMMHTKLCAVSHYIDMNGVEHRNAVWTSSSNLDGITSKGYNANWKLQTATIVSDHEEIYRISVNYLDLVAKYTGTIDGIYEFQDVANDRATKQIQLILAGKESEIPSDEQIVYLGGEGDDVFELYFTPFGGGTTVWDEVNNPYCKYLRELYNSEDYILFSWNAAEYSSEFPLGKQMEAIINGAFTGNKNPKNAFYGRMEHFDGSIISSLERGVEIGYYSLNELRFNQVHNKDILMSYVKDGQRYYVSLLNSCNMHSGSMCFQSNFALVIKEKECREDGVFFTMADNSTIGIVEHAYGDEQAYLPEDGSHGYYYRACEHCDKTMIGDLIHRPGDWIVDREAKVGVSGIQHKECTVCGSIIETKETFASEESVEVEYSELWGISFPNEDRVIDIDATGALHTIEATIQLDTGTTGRGGVVVGNYIYGSGDVVNLEIYNGGQIRLYYRVGGVSRSYVFEKDIRSNDPVHIAVTVDAGKATLYINGELSETLSISGSYPGVMSNIRVGGDNRTSDIQTFKGKIYSVALFSDVRNALEISRDAVAVSADSDGLLYARVYTSEFAKENKSELEGVKITNSTDISTGYISAVPHTLEAIISLEKNYSHAGGVIIGNCDGESGVNFEIYSDGNPGLYYEVDGVGYSCVFDFDVRLGNPVHIALTIDDLVASLYVNGRLIESLALEVAVPESGLGDAYTIGNDNGVNRDRYFRGTIIGIALFANARSSVDIAHDAVVLPSSGDSLLYSAYFKNKVSESIVGGTTFGADTLVDIGKLSAAPKTFEAIIRVPTTLSDRAGVIVGNYNGMRTVDQINLEIYNGGKPRLYYLPAGEESVSWVFDTDIRSDKPVHIAVTVEGGIAKLYVNGRLAETVNTNVELPEPTVGFKVGGDRRPRNVQYFKGGIYEVNLFSDVRSAAEIMADYLNTSENTDSLIYSGNFYTEDSTNGIVDVETFRPVGQKYDGAPIDAISGVVASPSTIEATVMVPTGIEGRAGVIIGNYVGDSRDQLNIEVYEKGKIRLFYVNDGNRVSRVFNTDVRSDNPVHIALVIDGTLATLYLNGVPTESTILPMELPEITTNYAIGGDYRPRNTQYFKGVIYSVALFGDVRSADEVASDVRAVSSNEDNLIYSAVFTSGVCVPNSMDSEHVESDWIVYREQSDTVCAAMYKKCTVCGILLATKAVTSSSGQEVNIDYTGSGFAPKSEQDAIAIDPLQSLPKTFEALIKLPKDYSQRAGVIFGSYDGSNADGINLEIYTNGNPRLYYKVGKVGYSIVFNADVRSDALTHIAVTIDGLQAKLYINGALVETAELEKLPPEITEGFNIGNDDRPTSGQYFKGTIYAVHFFDDVRTDEEIALDAIMVESDADGLLASYYYTEK